MLNKILSPKYGVTEKKKAELDSLTSEVLEAQNEVEQLTAIVNSLQDKVTYFNGYLSECHGNKEVTAANKDKLDSLLRSIVQLMNNSDIAFNEMVLADSKIKDLTSLVNMVMNKLIYSAEILEKLGNLIIRKKALNPLISDELVSLVTAAGTDANNAVSLTLIALESVFAAQATSLEAEAATALEYTESMKLYEVITGTNNKGKSTAAGQKCLKNLIDEADKNAEIKYKEALKADKEVLNQLGEVQAKLSKAQINLQSLQAGLAAANAAALAS